MLAQGIGAHRHNQAFATFSHVKRSLTMAAGRCEGKGRGHAIIGLSTAVREFITRSYVLVSQCPSGRATKMVRGFAFVALLLLTRAWQVSPEKTTF